MIAHLHARARRRPGRATGQIIGLLGFVLARVVDAQVITEYTVPLRNPNRERLTPARGRSAFPVRWNRRAYASPGTSSVPSLMPSKRIVER
jgi:hypothetical protein